MKMNCLKKQLIYSVLIFNLFLTFSIQAQDIAGVFDLANKMKLEGNYEASIKLYQRVSFFGDGYKNTECLIGTADSYFNLKDYNKAAEFYEFAYFSTTNDSLKNLIALSKSAIFIYNKKFLEALQELFSIEAEEGNVAKAKNIYLATAYYGLNRFNDCKTVLFDLISDTVSKTQLDKLIKRAERVQRRNPKTAKILSMIIPGMGQFYAGDIKNGINSLLITSAFMYLMVNTSIQYSVFEATSVLPWFSRYYVGGFNRAQTITINRVEDRQYQIYLQIMKIVEQKS